MAVKTKLHRVSLLPSMTPAPFGLVRTWRPAAISFSLACVVLPGVLRAAVYQPLDAFTCPPSLPSSGLTRTPDGYYYGTTSSGGAYQRGTIYRSGAGTVTTVVSFDGTNGDHPVGGVIRGSDGNLYGVTKAGGAAGHGTFFQLTPQGQLTAYPFQLQDDSVPQSGLVQAVDGNFYGMASRGTSTGALVYRVTPQGVITLVNAFDFQEGTDSQEPLCRGADGALYGTTSDGGTQHRGTAFKVTLAGEYTRLASFDSFAGYYPGSGLVLASDGNFYGTTQSTAAGTGTGTVFRLTSAGDLSLMATLTATQGLQPLHPLVEGTDGYLYGSTQGSLVAKATLFRMKPGSPVEKLHDMTAAEGGAPCGALTWGDSTFHGVGITGMNGAPGTLFTWMPTAQFLSTEANFSSHAGLNPASALVLAPDGYFYGSTYAGGLENAGTTFRALPEGDLFRLHEFNDALGRQPWGAITVGPDGLLYGTAASGGGNGVGVVYLYPKSAMTNPAASGFYPIASFGGADGASMPTGGLVMDEAGNGYGSTLQGTGGGKVYKVTPAGQLTVLATISGIHGDYPIGRLVRDADGNLYGVARDGGAHDGGTIFQVAPNGTVTTLADFDPVDGAHPSAGLLLDAEGNLWGTTVSGGPAGKGSIFRLTAAGVLETLVRFDGTNGAAPRAELAFGPDGNLYGTTAAGGTFDQGTVYRITPAGVFTKVTDLDYVHGAAPQAGLTSGPDGRLYGVTFSGGTDRNGRVTGGGQFFRLQFGPSVKTLEGEDNASTAVTFHGEVNPNGSDTTVVFQYKPAGDGFEGYTTVEVGVIPGTAGTTAVEKKISGLEPDSYYDFRIVAWSAENTSPQVGAVIRVRSAGVAPNAGPDQFLFTALDTNLDNLVSESEWRLVYQTPPRKEAIFPLLDQNGDGQLQWVEFIEAPNVRAAATTYRTALERTKLFLRVDTSEDNLISRQELAKMWKPGTAQRTIDAWWNRAGAGDAIDFYEWLHLRALPSVTTYELAEAVRSDRADTAAALDTDHDQIITFAEFSHLYKAGTKTTTIDTAWRAANGTARGVPSPASMTLEAFVEAARLPKLVVY